MAISVSAIVANALDLQYSAQDGVTMFLTAFLMIVAFVDFAALDGATRDE